MLPCTRFVCHAASNGNLKCVRRLLKSQATRDTKDAFDRTPLTTASQGGHAQVIRELFTTKTNYSPVPDPNHIDKEGWTPLLWACSFGNDEACRVLLEFGADVNMPSHDRLKKSPLFIAIENKFPKTVRVLLENGCQ